MKIMLYIAMLCRFTLLYAQEKVVVKPMGPQKNHCFNLVPFGKGWVYVTDETTWTLASRVNQDNKPLFRILATDSSFERPYELKGLSYNNVNAGPVVFYAQETKAILTRNLYGSSKEKARLGLFFLILTDGEWRETGDFAYNHPAYSCGHASVNDRGDTLIFSSDMPGGAGGTDLYMSVFRNGQWTKPVNLSKLNSSGNEMFPFLHPNGKLFFSSDRLGGRGGLDVYAATTVMAPDGVKALDTAINGIQDDFAYRCSRDELTGTFSSNRNGYDRLYSFSQWVPEFKNCTPWEETILCYDFYEEATVEIKEMPLVYEWDFGDGNKIKKLRADHCYAQPGRYTVRLNVMDTVINKLYMNEATYDLEIVEPVQPLITYENKTNQLTLQAAQGTWNEYPIAAMYWKDGGVTRKGPLFTTALNENESKNIYLLIRSNDYGTTHCFQRTISIKTEDQQEQKLSLVESEKTVAHSPDTTIEEVYRVVLNESVSRKAIDKTHFKELYTKVNEYYFPDDSLYRYTIGEARHPLALKPFYDQAHKAGFNDAHVKEIPAFIESTSKYEVSRTAMTAINEQKLDSLLGNTFELPLVYFDYNKTNIKPECEEPLNIVAEYLNKHPDFELEITAHTDNHGPDQFNLALSEKRAEAVFAYLAGRNVAPARMKKKGHGEAYPKYPNTTDEHRARNRRVEFRILK